jgi:predicted GIY-YIG superfamily endonuclease
MNARDERILALYDDGLSSREIAAAVTAEVEAVSQPTVTRVIRRHRAGELRRPTPYSRRYPSEIMPVPKAATFVRHVLYRFYSDSRALLYVGITDQLQFRLAQHAEDKHWFDSVATIEVSFYSSRAELEAAEREAIALEKPMHNFMYNRLP